MVEDPKPKGGEKHTKPDNTGTQKQERDIAGDVQIRGGVFVQLPPEIAFRKDAADDKKEARENKKYRLEKISIVILTLYAGLTAIQSCQSIRSANAARDAVKVARDTLTETQRSNTRQEALTDAARITSQQDAQNATTASQTASQQSIQATQDAMRLDQRAWVGLSVLQNMRTTNPKNGANVNDLSLPIVKNTGKTPAENVRIVSGIYAVNPSICEKVVHDSTWMEKLADGVKSGVLNGVFSISNSPRSPSRWMSFLFDPSFFPKEDIRMWDMGGGAPGTSSITPRTTVLGVLPPDIPLQVSLSQLTMSASWRSASTAYIFYGEISYKDIWGTSRLTTFCEYTKDLSAGGFAMCPTYNNMR